MNLFSKLGEEPEAKIVATQICRQRKLKPLETTEDLCQSLRQGKTGSYVTSQLARVFQAIRMHVNDEVIPEHKLAECLFNLKYS